ncbi:MAG: flagellar assembly peptidoglycan hydrolase FlgJ [Candidatus Methylumidiphilus sp.]
MTDIAGGIALDPQNLNALRQHAKANSPQAANAAAKQMESLFVNMMLKAMRQATPQDGLLDNEQTRLFSAMLDSQISQHVHVGLADMMIKQLSNPAIKPHSSTGSPSPETAAELAAPTAHQSKTERIQAFLTRFAAHAEQASQSTAIPARFMLSQAALESGWGRREIRAADGSSSRNLFGIKATKSWKGRTVDCVTTEYIDGVAHKQVEKFRAYDSYAETFLDYANLLRNNPRYRNVLANADDPQAFAYGLQRAGYATDPRYGAKLVRIIRQMDMAQAALDNEAKVL